MATASPDIKKPVELDVPASDIASELARARARIAELEAQATKSANQAPATNFTSATEIDAGKDEEGTQWWWYKVDLPPVGGVDIKCNGVPYYHGEQYKVTTDTLRTIKDIVFRNWKHESDIHGSNENFYRQPKETVLRGNRR